MRRLEDVKLSILRDNAKGHVIIQRLEVNSPSAQSPKGDQHLNARLLCKSAIPRPMRKTSKRPDAAYQKKAKNKSTLDQPRPARKALALHPSQESGKLRVYIQWLDDLFDFGFCDIAFAVVGGGLALEQQQSGHTLKRNPWLAAHCD